MIEPIKKAILLVGGRGLRMKQFSYDANKTVVSVLGKPNLVNLMHQLHKAGVRNFFLDCHYQAHSIVKAVTAGQFGHDVKVDYCISDELRPDGESIRRIVQNKKAFPDQHEFFWVVSGDVFYPTADLGGFETAISRARESNKEILGGIGFVKRPQHYMINREPSAIIDGSGLIKEFTKHRLETVQEAERVWDLSGVGAIKSETNTEHKLPMNTSAYIISKELLSRVGRPPVGAEEEYDLGKFVFTHPRAMGKVYGHIFPPFMEDEFIYHNITEPEDVWRIQYTYLMARRSQLKEHYNESTNSWHAANVNIDRTGVVKNSFLGPNVTIGENAALNYCIVLGDCWVENVELNRVVIFPDTWINYRSSISLRARYELIDSLLGGRSGVPTRIDLSHPLPQFYFDKALLVPGDNGIILPDPLDLSEEDLTLPGKAFSIDKPNKKDGVQTDLNFK